MALATVKREMVHRAISGFTPKETLFELAEAYAFHLAKAQAFVDGNKRSACFWQ